MQHKGCFTAFLNSSIVGEKIYKCQQVQQVTLEVKHVTFIKNYFKGSHEEINDAKTVYNRNIFEPL